MEAFLDFTTSGTHELKPLIQFKRQTLSLVKVYPNS